MKYIVLTILISAFLFTTATAQDADTMPYQKYGVLPTFEALTLDSNDIFNTYTIPEGRPIVVIYFSPDCDHCEDLTKEILEHIDEFKKTRIYMLTLMNLVKTKEFCDKLHLEDYKNIKVYKDFLFFGLKFYGFKAFPFAAVYDGDKKLVKGFPHKLTAELLAEAVQEAKK